MWRLVAALQPAAGPLCGMAAPPGYVAWPRLQSAGRRPEPARAIVPLTRARPSRRDRGGEAGGDRGGEAGGDRGGEAGGDRGGEAAATKATDTWSMLRRPCVLASRTAGGSRLRSGRGR